MKQKIISTTLMMLLCASINAQVNSGSNGSDGALDFSGINYTTNIVIDMHDHPTGIYQYTYVNIPGRVTVTFIPNANNTPVVWLVQSNVSINGVISLNGNSPNSDPFNNFSAVGGLGGPGGWAGGSAGSLAIPGQGPGGGTFNPTNGYSSGGSYGSLGGTPDAASVPVASIYGNNFLLPLMGGSGGGAGCGYGGGGGGGAILIAANSSIQVNGSISATGAGGGSRYGCGASGGSGGGVRLVTMNFTGTGVMTAAGGGGGNATGSGAGGNGRIRIDAFQNTFGGSIAGEYTQGFQPIIIPASGQGVQLTVASVGGVAVPANPSGQPLTPDALISGQQANPIPIVVNCVNLPLNTPVTVTVKPATGASISAVGYNNTGTTASSTATISLNMPRGGGIIYATTATGN